MAHSIRRDGNGETMRYWNSLCGVAVLLTTLAIAHRLLHVISDAQPDMLRNPVFWAAMTVAAIVVFFSLAGGCLLLKRER